ncbi:hypothetical protein BTVI_00855 [Pitangus sulphuratus]|nr:hypothetical protein BTVI_00855 [Pitangus sulphuratus]
MDELHPLFELLSGDPDLRSPRFLTPEALKALSLVEQKISQHQTDRKIPNIPPILIILIGPKQPYGLIGQLQDNNADFLFWEWVFLPHQFGKTLVTLPELLAKATFKGRIRCWEMSGEEPSNIYLPLTSDQLEQMLITSLDFQLAIANFTGQLKFHLPSSRLLQKLKLIPLEPKFIQSATPLPNALTVFTDGSGKTGNAVTVWRTDGEWKQNVHKVEGSSQIVELSAVVRVFQIFSQIPLNIISDSAYVDSVVQRAENAYLKHLANQKLFLLFKQLL